jgi:hypothetical protein
MLALPTKLDSTNHNRNFDQGVFCDWIEASLLLSSEGSISKTDINDLLIENLIFNEESTDELTSSTPQDKAALVIDQAWYHIKRRVKNLGISSGIDLTDDLLVRNANSALAHRFLLALTCKAIYPEWGRIWDTSASEYGELFEQVSEVAVAQLLQGWKVQRLGWGRSNTTPLRTDVDQLTIDLREPQGSEVDLLITSYTKDMGLDLVAYRPFGDHLAALPILFFQCASGQNWQTKLSTPNLHRWGKVISFTSQPKKALTLPFAFLDAQQFRKDTMDLDGIVLERYRLLQGLNNLNQELSTSLENWLAKVSTTLPT